MLHLILVASILAADMCWYSRRERPPTCSCHRGSGEFHAAINMGVAVAIAIAIAIAKD
jgi:hypothetical protein